MNDEPNAELNQGAQEVPANPAEAAPLPPAPVILVVEDDQLTRRAVGRKLQAAGYEVMLVPSAADALIVSQRTIFQVMVLDLQLPDGMDGIHEGFSMLDWLHRQLGDFKFRIVVHTSQRSVDVLRRADQHGVFAVCHKRRDLDNLLQSVADALESLKKQPDAA